MFSFFLGNYTDSSNEQHKQRMLDLYKPWLFSFQKKNSSDTLFLTFVTDFSLPAETKDREEVLSKLGPGDYAIFPSLMDVSPYPEHAASLLSQMSVNGVKIYLLSINPSEEFSSYSASLISFLEKRQNSKSRKRVTKYPIELLNYAVTLREQDPPVRHKDIQKYSGIPPSTLVEHMKRTKGKIAKKRKSREINNMEITILNELKKNNRH